MGNGAFEEQSALVNINGGRCIFVRITQILIHFNTNTEANTTTNTLAHVAGEQSGAVKIIGAASLSRQCTPFTWICESRSSNCVDLEPIFSDKYFENNERNAILIILQKLAVEYKNFDF